MGSDKYLKLKDGRDSIVIHDSISISCSDTQQQQSLTFTLTLATHCASSCSRTDLSQTWTRTQHFDGSSSSSHA